MNRKATYTDVMGKSAMWKTASADETFALGAALGRCLVDGLTVALVGPLGAGKTQFVKGIAAGNAAGPAPRVTSPTFTLVHEYPGRLYLYHVDVYRLSGPRALAALGFDEMIRPNCSVVVEWADRVRDVIPGGALWIDLHVTGERERSFEFDPTGGDSRRCVEALRTVQVSE